MHDFHRNFAHLLSRVFRVPQTADSLGSVGHFGGGSLGVGSFAKEQVGADQVNHDFRFQRVVQSAVQSGDHKVVIVEGKQRAAKKDKSLFCSIQFKVSQQSDFYRKKTVKYLYFL